MKEYQNPILAFFCEHPVAVAQKNLPEWIRVGGWISLE